MPMLITTELTRDVLCHEVIEASKWASDGSQLAQHLINMRDILMSPNDFVHVDADVWSQDLTDLASQIAEARKENTSGHV